MISELEKNQYARALFIALLNLSFHEWNKLGQYGDILPHEMIELLTEIRAEKIVKTSFASYISFMEDIAKYSQDDVLQQYLKLGIAAYPLHILEAVPILQRQEKWSLVLLLYSNLPSNLIEFKDMFWQDCGKSFFYLRDYESARECFNNALNLLEKINEKEVLSYLAWCHEALKNE